MEKLLEAFKAYLVDVGYGVGTAKALPEYVERFMFHYKVRLYEIDVITVDQIKSYYESLQERLHQYKNRPLSEKYIADHIYGLSVFFGWLEMTGVIEVNPMSGLRFKRLEQNPREPLTREEINALFNACEDMKEVAVLHLCYSCGLRRSEAEVLNVGDVHLAHNLLYVQSGKGGKRRVIPLTDKVCKELELYLKYERIESSKDKEAFVYHSRGGRLRGYGFNQLLKEIISRTNVSESVSLHHLRHSLATHLLENEMDIEDIKELLGHSTTDTTQIYAKYNNQLTIKNNANGITG